MLNDELKNRTMSTEVEMIFNCILWEKQNTEETKELFDFVTLPYPHCQKACQTATRRKLRYQLINS